METKNEKDLRMYIQPETEEIEMRFEGVICESPIEPVTPGGGI